MAVATVLNFQNVEIFRGGKGQEGENASPCQILSKSVKSRPRCGDFSIFQDGGRRHLGFLKLQIFNGRDAQEGQAASPCQISSKSLNRGRDMAIFWFSTTAAAAILDF